MSESLFKKIALISFIFLGILLSNSVFAEEPITVFKDTKIVENKKYYLRLVNGDILTGEIVEIFIDEKEGEAIKIKTEIGTATIYGKQVAAFRLLDESYRQTNRIFLMPTAEPIGNNHFIGAFEGVFLYAGVGWEWLSVTAGRTFVPTVSGSEQFSLLTAKASVYHADNENTVGGVTIGLGGSLAFLNARNQIQNIFANATFTMTRTRLTGLLFYKAGNESFFTASAGTIGSVNVKYPNGAFGIGIGIDTKLTEWNDLHFIAEGWNNDIQVPFNSAALLGIRIGNTSVSADFGVVAFTAPAFVPFMSFSWTPF
ncbi:MAG: hypothetical protein JST20_10160 [Bacteroidetes bacterium]|nr:hypothetical protein [Bacteroidota bacterium]